MTGANDPAAWQNFYVMIGTANAAITGLLFVALSIHLRQILEHPVFKPRAVLVLVVLTTQIVIAAVVLTPQPRLLMGVEILVLNAFFLGVNLRYRTPARASLGTAITLLVRAVYVYAALSLVLGVGGGFYVLGAVLVVTLARSMQSCWTLLTALERDLTT
jgi:modulator of FtsH protease